MKEFKIKSKSKISTNAILEKKLGTILKQSYCIVIPFENERDLREILPKIKKTRKDIMDEEKEWWCDGMIIEKKDYERLLKKSKAIEIFNIINEDI